METTISVNKRFCGPPRSGNGGYVCGLVAKVIPGLSEVKLLAPPPLDSDLTLEYTDNSATLTMDGSAIAKAAETSWDMTVPKCPDIEEALTAQENYLGFTKHDLPGCFVCGPKREIGDGLRIFAGTGKSGNIVSAVWEPANLPSNHNNEIDSEFIWAALDCPGFFAVTEQSGFALLGSLSVKHFHPVFLDQKYIVTGWHAGSEGRKHTAGTALFDEQGKLVAQAKAIWVSVDKTAFV